MKIAVCTNFFAPSVGGSEIVTEKISKYLTHAGHDVRIFTRSLVERKKNNYESIQICEYQPISPFTFLNQIKKFKPDGLLIYSDVFDFVPESLELNIPVVLCMCGGNRIEKKSQQRHILEHISKIKKIVIHSEHEQCYPTLKRFGLLEKTDVVPNGVDLSEFNIDTPIDREKILDSKYTSMFWVINISNFFPGKNQYRVFDIINRMNEKNVLYIQISSNTNFPICKREIQQWRKYQENNKVKSILFQGLERHQILNFLRHSNVLLFTSEKEVGPLVILEAMAMGVPWVSADVGEVKSLPGGLYVSTPKTPDKCCIFDERVLDKMAKNTSYVMTAPKIGEDGKKYIQSRDWNNILPSYEKICQESFSQVQA